MISEGKVDILNNSRRLDNLCEGPKRDLIRSCTAKRWGCTGIGTLKISNKQAVRTRFASDIEIRFFRPLGPASDNV